jgi:hypothetical protein
MNTLPIVLAAVVDAAVLAAAVPLARIDRSIRRAGRCLAGQPRTGDGAE